MPQSNSKTANLIIDDAIYQAIRKKIDDQLDTPPGTLAWLIEQSTKYQGTLTLIAKPAFNHVGYEPTSVFVMSRPYTFEQIKDEKLTKKDLQSQRLGYFRLEKGAPPAFPWTADLLVDKDGGKVNFGMGSSR